MNIGQKINALFERSGYKTYTDWGKAMGIPGDWLLDMKKRDIIKNVDIGRLITIAEYNQTTVDELLKDSENYFIDIKRELPDNDIVKMLNRIQDQLQDDVKFNGFAMSNECREITHDAINILKSLIQSNL